MAIQINSYTLNNQGDITYNATPDLNAPDNINAYYIEDQWASNITTKEIIKILQNEVKLDSLNSLASSLFCDGKDLYVFQANFDAKYFNSETLKNSPLTFCLRRTTLGLPQPDKPSTGTPYIYNGTTYFAISLDTTENSGMQYSITLNPYDNNKAISNTADDIYLNSPLEGYRFYVNQDGRPKALASSGVVKNGNSLQKVFQSNNNGYVYGYMNGYHNGNFFYYIHSNSGSVDPAVSPYNYCQVFYKGSTCSLSLYGGEKSNYFSQIATDNPKKEGFSQIENSNPDFKITNPLTLNKNDGAIIKFFTSEMHGKKLYLKGGNEHDYITVYYRNNIGSAVNNGDYFMACKLSINSTLDLSTLKADDIFETKENDLCMATLSSNNVQPQVVELPSISQFIYKPQTSTTALQGYSNGIIYSDDSITQNAFLLAPTIPSGSLLNSNYDFYTILKTYNNSKSVFKDFPLLTQNTSVVCKYNLSLGVYEIDESSISTGSNALPQNVANNLVNNTYLLEYPSVNRYTFTPTLSWKSQDQLLPLIAEYDNGNSDLQVLNSEIFTLAVYTEATGIASNLLTFDGQSWVTNNNINIMYKV